MTPDELRADHAKALVKAAAAKDLKGNTNAPEDVNKIAFNGVRTAMFARLQEASPPPGPHADDEGDPELHHARQKRHNKNLWKQVEAAMAAAGLTENGAS